MDLPFVSSREYRHRRRHRKDLNKLITDAEAVEEENGAAVQKSNSFRRRRNDSGEENPFTKRKMDQQELELKVEEPYISTEIATLHSTITLPSKEAENHDICISVHTDEHINTTKTNVLECKSDTKDVIKPDTEANELLTKSNCPSVTTDTFGIHDSLGIKKPEDSKDDTWSTMNVNEDVQVQGSKEIVKAETEAEEEEDPLGFIAIKSAAQWMAVSKRISWNFEDKETEDIKPNNIASYDQQESNDPPVSKITSTVTLKQIPEIVHDYENASYDIYCPEYNGQPEDFKPTKYYYNLI